MSSWKVTFKDKNEVTNELCIWDHSGMWDDDQSCIALTGGAVPFEVNGDADDSDFFTPVRTSSGYIRLLINNATEAGYLTQIVANYWTDVKVGLYRSGDGWVWQGYVQPQEISQDWGPTPYEVEIAVVDCLGVLEYISFQGGSQFTNIMTIGQYIYNMAQQSMFIQNNAYFPNNLCYTYDEEGEQGEQETNLDLRLCLASENFWDFTDEKRVINASDNPYEQVSWLDVIESICKFFGWSLVLHGGDLYFLSMDVHYNSYAGIPCDYRQFTIAGLNASTPTMVDSHCVNDVTPTIDGADHTVMTRQSAKSVEVTVENKTPDNEVVGSSYESYMTNIPGTEVPEGVVSGDTYVYATYCDNNNSKVSYLLKSRSGLLADTASYGGEIVKHGIIPQGKGFYRADIQDEIVLKNKVGSTPDYAGQPAIKFTCQTKFYKENQGLQITGNVKCCDRWQDYNSAASPSSGFITAKIKCGNYYFSLTSGWLDTELACGLYVTDGSFQTATGAGLYRDWYGCSGLIIPFKHTVGGTTTQAPMGEPIEITLYTHSNNLVNYRYAIISGFSVKVVSPKPWRNYTLKDCLFREVNKVGGVPVVGGEDVDVELDVCSYSPNAEDGSYSVLRFADGSVAKTTRSGWACNSLEIFEDQSDYPEQWLAEKLARWGHKRRRIVEAVVEGVSYKPEDKIVLSDGNYAILAQHINYRDYQTTLTLIEL